MDKILEIEDVKLLNESGRKIARFIFNNDKVVRVNIRTGEILTPNVPKTYSSLISIYLAHYKAKQSGLKTIVDKDNDGYDDHYDYDEEEYSKPTITKRYDYELQERINSIKSGKGAGLGVFLGFLLHFTIIGPLIAGLFSLSFLNDISDEEYLRNTDTKEINFRKGFYSACWFGLIVSAACCDQWKNDMVSILVGKPTKQSQNKHICFRVWFWLTLGYEILQFIYGFLIGYANNY